MRKLKEDHWKNKFILKGKKSMVWFTKSWPNS